MIRKTIVTE